MLYEEFAEGIFLCYRETQYAEKRRAIDRSNGPWAKTLGTPELYGMSPYKLHITLDLESYNKFKKDLILLLTEFVSEKTGALKDFKCINPDLIKSNSDVDRELIRLFTEYKEFILHDTPFDNEAFQRQLQEYYGEEKYSLEFDSIDAEIQSLSNQIITRDRFLTGDQFTIYIPEKFNKKIFLKLCQQVNSFLSMNNATPGNLSDVASPVGPYMSLRQEYLHKDYKSINQNQRVNQSLRIDSLTLTDNEEDKVRRKKVVTQQENSRLYQYLTQQAFDPSFFARKKSVASREKTEIVSKRFKHNT